VSDEEAASTSVPTYKARKYRCPYCNAFSQQVWEDLYAVGPAPRTVVAATSTCAACDEYALWRPMPSLWTSGTLPWRMVYPSVTAVGPRPHVEMPAKVKEVYEEARSVAATSPRAGTALLRLALDILVRELLEDASRITLNDAIARVIAERQLSQEAQRMMDVLRFHGNDALHPVVELDAEGEEEDLVPALAVFLNTLVEETIARAANAERMYQALPEGKRAEIERRDTRAREAKERAERPA